MAAMLRVVIPGCCRCHLLRYSFNDILYIFIELHSARMLTIREA